MGPLAIIPTERLEIGTVAAPSPEAPDDVIVRVEACGVCGTDLPASRWIATRRSTV
jgi:threonine dehydrogenase-like Zn-dependent dehydrogenase